ncbi:MAG: FAD-binding oxidoreductase [Rhodobacteraceae bacterium]|nr:FAD-binding oxidoreductase [Paracoccaceae bacterium]
MAMAALTVMGGGVFGLALAFVAATRGARVQVLERRRIGAGASGGVVGALAPHVPENWNAGKAVQLDALLMAEAFWAEVARISGRDPGYARTGRLQPVADAAGLARALARAEGAATLWQGRADWAVRPVSDFAGLVPVSPTGMVVHDTLSARLHPRRALAALAAGVVAQGGTVAEGADMPPEGRAPVVWCTGYEGLAALSTGRARPVGSGVKGQALRLAHDASALPQVFAEGLHIVPHVDGSVAIGSTSERDFTVPDRTDAQCDALLERVRALCPALAGAPVLERWAGVRPRARTRAPMLGRWPGRPGHYVFNGGFKTGFALAPLLAGIMCDLVLEGRDRVPDGFRVEDNLQAPPPPR